LADQDFLLAYMATAPLRYPSLFYNRPTGWWPGVHSAEALLHGTPLQGHWLDRTRQYAARNHGEALQRDQYVFAESVVLSPIPCWAHLPTDRYRERIKTLVEEVDADTARARQQSGAKVLGARQCRWDSPTASAVRVRWLCGGL
jgi:hypothetical protein